MEIDEKILELKNSAKQAAKQPPTDEPAIKQSIYDETVDLFGYPTTFADRELLDGQISLRIPEDFVALDADVVHVLYPLGNRPQLVMGNEPFYFMIGFNHTQHRIPNEQMNEFPAVARALLEKCGPQVQTVKTETILCGDRQVATMHFISQTVDEALYNLMFYTTLDERLLIGFINFRYQDRKTLAPLAEEIVASYRNLAIRRETP